MRLSTGWLRVAGLSIGLSLSACAGHTPSGDESLYHSGLDALEAGHYGLAAERLRAAVNHNPSVAALNALGATYDQIGRYDLALRQYRMALALDPSSPQTLNNLGYSYLLQNRPDVALIYLRDARRHASPTVPAPLAANIRSAEQAVNEPARTVATIAPTTPPEPQSATATRIERMSRQVQVAKLRSPTQPSVAATVKPTATPPHPAVRPPRPMAVAATPPPHHPVAKPARPALTISNGADRQGMAVRMRDHLAERNWTVDTVATAAHHAHAHTVVLYRTGFRTWAEQLRRELDETDRQIELQRNDENAAALTLRLGNDLLAFDEALFHQAKTMTAQQRAPPPAPTIEIANGAGRTDMAARTRSYLEAAGLPVKRLRNADHFGYAETTLFYRPGHRESAEALIEMLPVDVRLVARSDQSADLHLRLGSDYLGFDTQLARAPPTGRGPA